MDEKSIELGISLADWFGSEARRIYRILDETEDEQTTRELIELIHRHGGEITARDLSSNYRARFATVEDAEQALNHLAETDCGGWIYQEPGPKGGRPTSIFRLYALPQNRKIPENTGNNEVLRLQDANGTQHAESEANHVPLLDHINDELAEAAAEEGESQW